LPLKKRGESPVIHIRLDLEGEDKRRFLYVQKELGMKGYSDIVLSLIYEKARQFGYKIRVEEPSQSQSEVAPQNQSQPRSEED